MTAKQTLLADVECYRNYFLLGFRNVETGNVRQLTSAHKSAKN